MPHTMTMVMPHTIPKRRPDPPSPDVVEAARRAESYLLVVEAEKAGMAAEEYCRLTPEQREAGKTARVQAAREVADAAQVGVNVERWRRMSPEERTSQAQFAQAAATLRDLCVSSRDVAAEIEALLRDQPGAACVPNSQGCTALHLVCENEAVEMRVLEAVLDAYPTATSLRNRFGSTPLHSLCENRCAPFEAVQLLLLANPAAATETNDGGATPLQMLRERRAPAGSAWGVAPRAVTVPAVVPAPPRERTPQTPTGANSPQRASRLPGIRSAQDAGVSSSTAVTPRTPRTPRSMRSQRTLQRLQTSARRSFQSSADLSRTSNSQAHRSVAAPPTVTIPTTPTQARARAPAEDEDDDFVASFRDRGMNAWVGRPIQDPRRYTERSFSGVPAAGSTTPARLKVNRRAHYEALLEKREEEQKDAAKMDQNSKKASRLHLFQAAGHMAMAMGESQAHYTAVRGPVLMGDGNPFTEEQRSVVLVSRRTLEKGDVRFSATSRHYLKVFITSKVLPQGTSLTQLDLPWIGNIFPFDEAEFNSAVQKPQNHIGFEGKLQLEAVDSEKDLPQCMRDAQEAQVQQHSNWLAELHRHGFYHREDLIQLDEDHWEQLSAIPEHAREVIKQSMKKDTLRPSDMFGLPSQIIPIEDAAVLFQGNKEAPGYGTLELQVSEGAHPDHPAKGRKLRFSSLLEPRRGDTDSEESKQNRHEQAAAEMRNWWRYIRASQLYNLQVDSGEEGNVVKGVKYAIASMPGEEFGLRCKLTYGVEADFRRAFEGDSAVSNLCVWTYKNGFLSASGKWKSNVEDAIADGQKLIVYSRRNWTKRRNQEDLIVSAQANLSWPGLSIEQKQGMPLDEYGTAQEREINWLKKQSWFDKRVELRPIESLDILRSDLGGGCTYVGEWNLDDEIDGHGKKTWPSGDVYTGDFYMALEHGQGKKEFANGDVYEGGWKNGCHDGEGRTTYENGDHYEGTWLKGLKSGSGTMRKTRENGDVYEGECFNGLEHGMGTLTCANGNVFSGSWKKGEMHGEGTHTYANGDVVRGKFLHLKIKHKGEYSWMQAKALLDTPAATPTKQPPSSKTPTKTEVVRHALVGEWNVETPAHVSGRVEFEAGDWYEGGWERGKRTPMTKGKMRFTSTDRCVWNHSGCVCWL